MFVFLCAHSTRVLLRSNGPVHNPRPRAGFQLNTPEHSKKLQMFNEYLFRVHAEETSGRSSDEQKRRLRMMTHFLQVRHCAAR